MAIFGIGNASAPIDEIERCKLERYFSSNRVVWRIFSFMNVIQQLFTWQYILKMDSACILQRKMYMQQYYRHRKQCWQCSSHCARMICSQYCYLTHKCQNTTHGMHQRKNFNIVNRVNWSKDIRIYILRVRPSVNSTSKQSRMFLLVITVSYLTCTNILPKTENSKWWSMCDLLRSWPNIDNVFPI